MKFIIKEFGVLTRKVSTLRPYKPSAKQNTMVCMLKPGMDLEGIPHTYILLAHS